MKILDINTIQEFVDYMAPYGTHVIHVLGCDNIVKNIHLTTNTSYNFRHNCQTSSGEKLEMNFMINESDV